MSISKDHMFSSSWCHYRFNIYEFLKHLPGTPPSSYRTVELRRFPQSRESCPKKLKKFRYISIYRRNFFFDISILFLKSIYRISIYRFKFHFRYIDQLSRRYIDMSFLPSILSPIVFSRVWVDCTWTGSFQ